MKIVCLVYAIVPLLISIKIHLLNTKLVSLTYSQDHKYKIFKDCPTECYQYCIFMAQRTQTSLTTWISVPIHAPNCACRSFALALCIWFLLIKEFIERKPMCRLHVPSRMRSIEQPLTTKLVVLTRPIPHNATRSFSTSPQSPVGKFPESCRKCSEVFGKLSGRKWRHSLVPRVPPRRPLQRPGHQGRHYRSLPGLHEYNVPRDYGALPGRYITDWHEVPEATYNPGDVILRPYMKSRKRPIVTAYTTIKQKMFF